MKTNIGHADRGIRVVLGVTLIVLALVGWIGPWGWVGLIPVLTGLARSCPLYSLLGISSCPVESKELLQFHGDLPVSFHHDGKV